jgi:endonuclease/exonuclease/phosphatase family metal-dependent hydrolase
MVKKRERQIIHDLIFRCDELRSHRSCSNGDGCVWSAESGCIQKLENLKQVAPANLVRFARSSVAGTLTLDEDKGVAVVKTAIGTFEVGLPTSLRLLFDTQPAVFRLKLSKPPSLQKNAGVILDGLKTAKYNRMLGVIQCVDDKDDGMVDVKLRRANEQAFTMNYAYLTGSIDRLRHELRVPKSNVFQYPTEVELDLSLLVGKVTRATKEARVVSYNVSWGVQSDDERSSEGAWVETCRAEGGHCRANVAAFLRDTRADIMMLQEFVASKELMDVLKTGGYEVATWKSGEEGAAVAVSPRMGRMLQDPGVTGRDARVLACASIGDLRGRPAIAVYLPHVRTVAISVHAGHDAQKRDADLEKFVRSIPMPHGARNVVMGGDFNGRVERVLTVGNMQLHLPTHWPSTCCRAPKGTVRGDGASDAILFSGHSLNLTTTEVRGSDHDPVQAVVELVTSGANDVTLELLPLHSDHTIDDDTLKHFSAHKMFDGTVARAEVRIVETQY